MPPYFKNEECYNKNKQRKKTNKLVGFETQLDNFHFHFCKYHFCEIKWAYLHKFVDLHDGIALMCVCSTYSIFFFFFLDSSKILSIFINVCLLR